MPFNPTKKATLRMPSGPPADPDRLHLWILLTDICPAGAHLLVSTSTLKEGRFHDPCCIIEPGEHRRIKLRSWIEYRRCKVILSTSLINGEAAWLYHADDLVTDGLFERICAGLMDSEHTAIRNKRYFEGKGPAF
jgi:hypothetical protein